jgi:putative spermidine/putrescine transport system ATP-binding protein
MLLRTEIRAIQRALGITTIYVTHDQEEALSLSDRVVVMKDGRTEQVGTPFEIYNRPATPFVASFIGSINLIRATVADPAAGEVLVDGQAIRISAPIAAAVGAPLRLSLRPELIALQNGTPVKNRLEGVLSAVVFLGSIVRLSIRTGANEIVVDTFNDPTHPAPATGARVTVTFPAEACVLVPEDSV